MNETEIRLGDEDSPVDTNAQTCGNARVDMSDGSQIKVLCNSRGRYLYAISRSSALGLCEVEIYEADTNLLASGGDIDYAEWEFVGGSSVVTTSASQSSKNSSRAPFLTGVQAAKSFCPAETRCSRCALAGAT